MTSDELRAWRTRLGKNQNEAAEMLNHPARTYHNWEQGHRAIPGSVEMLTWYVERYGAREMVTE